MTCLHYPLTGIRYLCIGNLRREDRVIRSDVNGTNNTRKGHGLLLVIDLNEPVPLDDEVAVFLNVGNTNG